MKSVSLFIHLHRSLSPYRWVLSLSVALLVSALFAFTTFYSRLDSNRRLGLAISPYLALLVGSSDRPELLRILGSISETTQSQLTLIDEGKIFATSKSVTLLDQPYLQEKLNFQFVGLDFDFTKVRFTSIVNERTFLVNDFHLWPSLKVAIGVFAVTLILSLLVSFFFAQQMKKAIKIALSPIDQLRTEISGLISEKEHTSEPIQIKELQEIQLAVRSTKLAFENAKDQLAESKAKKLSSESYKRLIHDLHNPVAALRQMATLASDNEQDLETKAEATTSMTRLADQILCQVTAAKRNLEEETVSLREVNIIDCLKESLKQVQTADMTKTITSSFDTDFLKVPHDPFQLKRAVVNLLENGIEASQSQVRLALINFDNQTMIRVCDDGYGMDESKVPVYFQGRGQSGKANRQAFGLSSTNHIVRSHGGRLIYKRSELGGASFEIRLGVV